ncbi:SDR family NAD(P)-dependent oxidoreductase [soil metagenome]
MARAPRIALVTGGNRGVGAAIARRLAEDGHRVAVIGRDLGAIESVASSIDGLALACDLTDPVAMGHALATLEERWGLPAILVQNAGIAESAPLAKTTDDAWARTFEINVHAPFRLARAVVPRMVKAGWGRVVHVASNAGLTGYAYTSAYCASKHALVGLTRALAAEIARSEVTVNAVCPGFVDTEMTDRTVEKIMQTTGREKKDARAAIEELSPQRRLMNVDEVAHVVAMLCDDGARGINGQAIAIDGGQVMR